MIMIEMEGNMKIGEVCLLTNLYCTGRRCRAFSASGKNTARAASRTRCLSIWTENRSRHPWHPFSHGKNYSSWAAFRAEGSGAVIYYGGEIVASASSFLSLSGEVELDVSTSESHREKKLATACVARMLRDCMRRGITVHWDAENEVSRHLAEIFGFEIEKEYSVYWVP